MKPGVLPENIGQYQKRVFQTDSKCVIEYSKEPKIRRYMANIDLNIDDVLFEVSSNTLEDAIRQAKTRISLSQYIKKDFPNTYNFNIAPIFKKQTDNFNVKKFDIHFIWNINENYQHIAIASSDIISDYKLIPDAINLYLKKFKNGDLLSMKYGNLDSKEYVFTKVVFLYTDYLNISKHILFNYFKKFGMKLQIRDDNYRNKIYEAERPDFFICHDSRDKIEVAKPLYEELIKKHLKVWYDEYSLDIGDSLTESIEKGIKDCRLGIIILSQNFLSNERWAKNELQSLKTKQIINNNKVILPIWHNIDEADLKDFSYWLIDKVGGNTKDGLEKLANKLSSIITKEKFNNR